MWYWTASAHLRTSLFSMVRWLSTLDPKQCTKGIICTGGLGAWSDGLIWGWGFIFEIREPVSHSGLHITPHHLVNVTIPPAWKSARGFLVTKKSSACIIVWHVIVHVRTLNKRPFPSRAISRTVAVSVLPRNKFWYTGGVDGFPCSWLVLRPLPSQQAQPQQMRWAQGQTNHCNWCNLWCLYVTVVILHVIVGYLDHRQGWGWNDTRLWKKWTYAEVGVDDQSLQNESNHALEERQHSHQSHGNWNPATQSRHITHFTAVG